MSQRAPTRRIILTNTHHLALASDLAPSQHTVVNLDTLETGLSDENPGLPVAADAPAAIYYTSGATCRAQEVSQESSAEPEPRAYGQ